MSSKDEHSGYSTPEEGDSSNSSSLLATKTSENEKNDHLENQPMESLVAVINKLQDVFYKINVQKHAQNDMIRLPQIVVIGSQSSGKSSVLEAIVKRDFLPRGSGIVTRCPLILQLQHVKKNDFSKRSDEEGTIELEEWGKFAHTGNKVYSDFDEIREEIIARTEEIAGDNKGISAQAINLKIFSNRVVDLTLVDLPGIIKVPVGDQPADIEAQIEKLMNSFISSDNSIILAVSPANADFANSDAIKAARKVDPTGERTLAVLTKLDIMDKGADASDVLSNNVIHVKMGIIGVVNRSQKDLNNKKSIADAKIDEDAFFQKRYPALAYRNGSDYLSKQLSEILHDHIAKCFPELKRRIQELTSMYQSRMKSFGAEIKDKSFALFKILNNYTNDYCSTLEGGSKIPKTDKLECGARIHIIAHDIFVKTLGAPGLYQKMYPAQILTIIKNIQGIHSDLFIPKDAFEQVAKEQIKKLEEPSMTCIENVHIEMRKIASSQEHYSTKNDLTRFPKLADKINIVVLEFLDKRKQATETFVKSLLEVELGYINVQHPDFYENAHNILKLNDSDLLKYKSADGIAASPPNSQAKNASSSQLDKNDICYEATKVDRFLSDKDIHDCRVVEHLFNTYYKIVRKSIQDMVPKSIITFLVNHVRDNLLKELMAQLNKPELYDILLSESVHIAKLRQETTSYLLMLEKAKKIINEVEDNQVL